MTAPEISGGGGSGGGSGGSGGGSGGSGGAGDGSGGGGDGRSGGDGTASAAVGSGPLRYTLPKLFDTLREQTKLSSTGGFACEPTFVYLVCNQHVRQLGVESRSLIPQASRSR